MAVMIVRESSEIGERDIEMNREHLDRIKAMTGLDETAIYTMLNSGKEVVDGHHRWRMVKQ